MSSEGEVSEFFSLSRTTTRKALDELLREGFIVKEHGRGSRVVERNNSLGLLTVKGFSEVSDFKVETEIIQEPVVEKWSSEIVFPLTEEDEKSKAIYFQRVRYINGEPIMLEHNWYSEDALGILELKDFIDGSFFKTLSQKYLIEIKGSSQELKAVVADKSWQGK